MIDWNLYWSILGTAFYIPFERCHQGTCIKDPWTKTMRGWRLNVGGGVGRAGGSNLGKMGTTVIEYQ